MDGPDGDGEPGRWSWASVLEDYREALATLERWGVTIPPGSRLERYAQLLEDQQRRILHVATKERLSRLLFALREMDEVLQIVESFPRGPGETARSKLEELVRGPEHPDESRSGPGPRDIQYELFLRAKLRQGGIPSALSSPDLLARVEGVRIPIEAKRPRKGSSVEGAVRKGVRQVEGGETRGVVALSLDLILRLEGTYLEGPSLEVLAREVESRLRSFVAEHAERLANRVRDRDVMGLYLTVRFPAWETSRCQPWVVGRSEVQMLHYSEEERELTQNLYRALDVASREGPYSFY